VQFAACLEQASLSERKNDANRRIFDAKQAAGAVATPAEQVMEPAGTAISATGAANFRNQVDADSGFAATRPGSHMGFLMLAAPEAGLPSERTSRDRAVR
jgi:hypothetical protein